MSRAAVPFPRMARARDRFVTLAPIVVAGGCGQAEAPPANSRFVALLMGEAGQTWLIASDAGYGFTSRNDLAELAQLRVPTLNGGTTTLGAVAELSYEAGPGVIQRLWRYRATSFPAPELDHIRYVCMVDDRRARELEGVRAPADAIARLEHVHRGAGSVHGPRRAQPGEPGAHHDNIDFRSRINTRHGPSPSEPAVAERALRFAGSGRPGESRLLAERRRPAGLPVIICQPP